MVKIDLHVHTNWGSSDSGLSPQELLTEAENVGLDVVCVTEHGTLWSQSKVDELAEKSEVVIIPGMEVTTDLGHVTVFGLHGYGSGMHKAETLKRAVDAVDGFMIAAHPFRRMFDDPRISGWDMIYTAEQAAELRIFSLVDEMEVVNGANNLRENLFALEVADLLGWTGVGGSDSHSTSGLGAGGIVMKNTFKDVQSFIDQLRSGKYYPSADMHKFGSRPFRTK